MSGARGLPSSGTEAGPPERITALGASAPERGLGVLKRNDLAIDAGLAHAPRDQLRHLAAEIDDQQLVVLGGVDHRFPRVRITPSRPRITRVK